MPLERRQGYWLWTRGPVPPGSSGITVGRLVVVRSARPSPRLVRHELVHVRQYAERGYLRFSFDYLRHYGAGLLKHRKSRKAYLDIPAEVEARADADDWRKRHIPAR